MENDQIEKRLEMLDQRLDALDSMVTALVERIMKQPVSIRLNCPSCGNPVEITLVANTRLGARG